MKAVGDASAVAAKEAEVKRVREELDATVEEMKQTDADVAKLRKELTAAKANAAAPAAESDELARAKADVARLKKQAEVDGAELESKAELLMRQQARIEELKALAEGASAAPAGQPGQSARPRPRALRARLRSGADAAHGQHVDAGRDHVIQREFGRRLVGDTDRFVSWRISALGASPGPSQHAEYPW